MMSLGYDRNGVIKHIIKNKIYQKTSCMIEKLARKPPPQNACFAKI